MFTRRFSAALIFAASLAALPHHASAQDRLLPAWCPSASHDSLGRSISGAELTVDGTTVRGVTDERGEVRFNAVRGGPATVHIRRLGFRPTTLDIIVDQRVPATCIVTLTSIPQRARDNRREGRHELHRPYGGLLSATGSGHWPLRLARAARARQSVAAHRHLPPTAGRADHVHALHPERDPLPREWRQSAGRSCGSMALRFRRRSSISTSSRLSRSRASRSTAASRRSPRSSWALVVWARVV